MDQHFDAVEVWYTDGSHDHEEMYANADVDLNFRMPGKELKVTSMAQVAQDWVGPSINFGPDGVQDVRLQLGNLLDPAIKRVVLQGPSGGQAWGWGWDKDEKVALADSGYNMLADFRNQSGPTGDLFVAADGNFSGRQFTLTVTYRDANRDGKTDSVEFTYAATTSATAAMPTVPNPNLAQFQAYSEPQDAIAPGKSHVRIVPGSLPTSSPIVAAKLGNQHGMTWSMGGADLEALAYDAQNGLFSFSPVRDEQGSTLTLALTFQNGTRAFARFAGARSDINLRETDTRVGATAWNDVNSAAALTAALSANQPLIHLKAGTYVFNAPIELKYPVRIKSDPGVTLTFVLNSSAEYKSWGAFYVNSSHVTLDGFSIRFQGTTTDFSVYDSDLWGVIEGRNNATFTGLSFTNLNIEVPRPSSVPSHYEVALKLIALQGWDSGVIAGNILKGGPIDLGRGPWSVFDNTYLGAVAKTTALSFLSAKELHDVVIRGNEVRQEEADGYAVRFFTFGRSDYGRWFNIDIKNNTVHGGIGNPATGFAPLANNLTELMMFEQYLPRFEGKPAAPPRPVGSATGPTPAAATWRTRRRPST